MLLWVCTTAAGAIITWIVSACGCNNSLLPLLIAMGLIAVLANWTAFIRIRWSKHQLEQ